MTIRLAEGGDFGMWTPQRPRAVSAPGWAWHQGFLRVEHGPRPLTVDLQ